MRNLVGQKFHHLTVIELADDYVSPKGVHYRQWRCKCDCGTEVITRETALISGHTKGCGQKHRTYQDMTGQRFGKLVVLEQAEDEITKKGMRHIRWLCKCDCGNEIVTRGTALRSGHTRSCGCAHSEAAMGIGLQDITGQKFGRWTVLYENGRLKEPRGRLVPLWHCRCDCGEERDLRAGTLKRGLSLSCGCYKYDRLSEIAKQGTRSSHLEKVVNDYLQQYGYYYEPQKIFPDLRSESGYPLSYDFLVYVDGVPSVLIECQGKQHYEPVEYFGGEKQFIIQKYNDKLKRDYANKIGFDFLEIPYILSDCDIVELLESMIRK